MCELKHADYNGFGGAMILSTVIPEKIEKAVNIGKARGNFERSDFTSKPGILKIFRFLSGIHRGIGLASLN